MSGSGIIESWEDFDFYGNMLVEEILPATDCGNVAYPDQPPHEYTQLSSPAISSIHLAQ